jgi:hypothetical protein
MLQRRDRSLVGALALFAAISCSASLARARPGGGHSFSSGNHSSGSHGSSGGSSGGSHISSSGSHSSNGGGGSSFGSADSAVLVIGLIVFGAFFGFAILSKAREKEGWETSTSTGPTYVPPAKRKSARKKLEKLRSVDEDFSIVLFEDVVYALYAELQAARGRGTLDELSPWIAANVRGALAAATPGLVEVQSVVVGSMCIVDVSAPTPESVGVEIEIEANYTEVADTNGRRASQAYWVVQRIQLRRALTARSKPPEKARLFVCPSCGAPSSDAKFVGGACAHCGGRVEPGSFDWALTSLQLLDRQPRGPQLTGTVEEEGTQRKTVVDPDAKERLDVLAARDRAFAWAAFRKRVELVFDELQEAWSAREWAGVRPYTSDALFETQLYWIQTYRAQHLRNVSENRPFQMLLAKVVTDRWFDAITVRIWAKGLDYTVDDAGNVVSGSRTRERTYTEYWTFIRRAGRSGEPRTAKVCPNCGAELKIDMAGSCEFCRVKVTSGDFDWVLSRIEQDDVYEG